MNFLTLLNELQEALMVPGVSERRFRRRFGLNGYSLFILHKRQGQPTEIEGQIFPYYLGREGIALFDSLMIHNEKFREVTWTIPKVRKNRDEKHKGGQ